MKKLAKVLILVWQLAFISAAATNLTALQVEKEDLIKALEKEKGELYTQIKTAINESLVALAKTNDSESKVAQEHLRELDQQVKEINETEGYEGGDGRRRFSGANAYLATNQFGTTLKVSLPPLARLKAEQEIKAWIAKVRAEKAAILKYKAKLKMINNEKENCPNFGFHKKKMYKEKGKRGVPQTYPCCRKCCKSSYMGCL